MRDGINLLLPEDRDELAVRGVTLRKYGQEVIRAVAGKRIHGTLCVPGGVNKCISAADRARTIQVLADPTAVREDLVQPGHVFPLRGKPGGVLQRAGHTEAAVDLARLAGAVSGCGGGDQRGRGLGRACGRVLPNSLAHLVPDAGVSGCQKRGNHRAKPVDA